MKTSTAWIGGRGGEPGASHRSRRSERASGQRADQLGDQPDDGGAVSEKNEQEFSKVRDLFVAKLDVDEEVADILVQEGFNTLEEVPTCRWNRMLEIESSTSDGERVAQPCP